MEDAVFGMLTFVPKNWSGGVAYWEKPYFLGLFNAAIPLRIYADDCGPTEAQRQVYLTFQQAEKTLKPELQSALFEFYQSEREVYAAVYADICADDSLGLSEEEFVPVLKTSAEIWKILTPDSWVIDEARENRDTVIYCHGCWDIEHGFSILFNEGRLVGIESVGGIFHVTPSS